MATWEIKLKRRHEFCQQFMREHKACQSGRPMVPLDGPRNIDSLGGDWWLQTNESMCELGFTYLGHLFARRNMLDHAWMIGRDEHEPWALVSEPYNRQICRGRNPVIDQTEEA
jgi:hypothetical protein